MGSKSSGPEVTATTGAEANAAGQEIDVRRYLGPDYCPETRIPPGTEMIRRYERGHDGEDASVIWQASVGETARECLYDTEGGLTMRIGVSGRVVAGPKGGPGAVEVPLALAVVKYEEKVLATEQVPLSVTVPASGSAVFREVREIKVPSPGDDRDYILYIGLDDKKRGLVDASGKPFPPPEKPVAKVEEPELPPEPPPVAPRRPAPAKPQPQPQPQQPNVLPTPSGGFVLPGG